MRAFLLLLLLAAVATLALQRGLIVVPARHNPWRPLDLADSPNWLTRFKLMRVNSNAQACRDALASSGLTLAPLPDRAGARGCGYTNAVQVRAGASVTHTPFTASCPLAVAYAMVERYAIEPAAQEIFGTGVARLEHYGSYACRNINHRAGGRLSEHARANALDLAGFVLDDGRRVAVARDWDGSGDAAKFLRFVHARACSFSNVVLGPEYNAAHADHFHLDMGGFRACR